MKKYFIIIMACVALLAAGCNKSLLDTAANDKYVESNFWNTQAAADAALSGCYNVLTLAGLFGGDATPLLEETASPNAYNYGNTIGFNFIAQGNQMPSSSGIIQSRWKDCYSGIGRCNTFLFNVNGVAMDDELRARMKGEAHFLRALYYFMLENYYGGVPLVLDPPDPVTQTDLPRTPRKEVVNLMLRDLDSATNALPVKFTGGSIGRATRGAALALKAKIMLFEASPLFNDGSSAGSWQAAADAEKAVMDLTEAGYGLFDDYRGLFLPENENNKEVIFDVQYIYPDLGTSFDLIDKQYNSNAPLLGLAQAYQMANGLPITDPASGYNADSAYAHRDPRLYATIVFPGDTFMTVPVTPTRFALTGFGLKKYSIYDKGAPPVGKSDLKDGQSETNYIILRYADVLLSYAEAQNEAAGPDPSIYEALNKVRRRAGMPDIDSTHTREQLREIIRQERRIEFAGEGMYYNDIRRWKTAESALNATIYTYNGSAIETRKFNAARDYWWPIPQTEMDLNPSLEQNAGY